MIEFRKTKASPPNWEDFLGLIPQFLCPSDPRPAAEQFEENYAHGGGWRPQAAWIAHESGEIQYPGDPKLKPVAMAFLREERIMVYPGAWVGIFLPDGSFQISHMD